MTTPAASRLSRAWTSGASQTTPLGTSRSETRACTTSMLSSRPEHRIVVVLRQELLDQQIDHLGLRVGIGACQHALQHAALTSDVGLEVRPVDHDRDRTEVPADHAPRIEGDGDARRRGELVMTGVRHMQAGQNQPHRLLQAAPLDIDVFGLDPDRPGRCVELGRQIGPRDLEIDRAGQQAQDDGGHQHGRDGDRNHHHARTKPIRPNDQGSLLPR